VYFNKNKAYLQFIVLITKTNNKRNQKVKPLPPTDNGELVNINKADSTIKASEGLYVGYSAAEVNYPRRIAFKVLDTYTKSFLAPPQVVTPVEKITEQIYDLWTTFAPLMPYPVFAFGADNTAKDILINTLKNIPLNDYVKRAIKDSDYKSEVKIDFSYLSKFETQDNVPLGAIIYFKNVKYTKNEDGSIDVHDWVIDRIHTDRFGMDKEIRERSYAVASRALLIDLSWFQHLFLCHMYGSSILSSEIIQCLEPNSRYRRLFAPFFMDSRSLLFDEVQFLTANPHGEIMRTTGFNDKGLNDYICISCDY